MTRYYTELPAAMANYPTPKLALDVSSLQAYEVWARSARAKLHDLLGLDNMRYCPPQPERLDVAQEQGYRRETWLIYTEPGIQMPLYLLIPDGMKPGEKRPAVICPHGHAGSKDATAGVVTCPELQDTITKHRYDYGRQACLRGFVAVCPDARGHGWRRESDTWGDDGGHRLASSCAWLNRMSVPLGRCVAGMLTWDLMRLHDWVRSLDFVDESRIGSMGLSGGGLQSLYFSAMDERISFSTVSGYFYGFRDALMELLNCSCNYVPRLWEYFDVGEIGALIAPRPLVIETGDEDPLNGKRGLDNVVPYVAQVRQAYALFGRGSDLHHDIFHGPHRWNGDVAMPKLVTYLG